MFIFSLNRDAKALAEKAAKDAAMARGDRSLPFRSLTADALARARARHGC